MRVLDRSKHRSATHAARLASGLSALVLAATSVAQSPPAVSPISPVPVQPPPSSRLPVTGNLPAPVVKADPKMIVGTWSHTRTDAETRSTDVVTIKFMADGRYQAQSRNSALPSPTKARQGRYAISNLQGNTFDLRIARDFVEPESDPKDAIDVQRITVIDSNTLRAADGSVVRRAKE